MTAGQAGDYTGASTLASSLSIAERLLGGVVMMRTGFAKPVRVWAQRPASPDENHMTRLSNTTSAVTRKDPK